MKSQFIEDLFKVLYNARVRHIALVISVVISISTAYSVTYTNQLMITQIYKQYEKIKNNPDDIKANDLIGLDKICSDPRFIISTSLFESGYENKKIKARCSVISVMHQEIEIR